MYVCCLTCTSVAWQHWLINFDSEYAYCLATRACINCQPVFVFHGSKAVFSLTALIKSYVTWHRVLLICLHSLTIFVINIYVTPTRAGIAWQHSADVAGVGHEKQGCGGQVSGVPAAWRLAAVCCGRCSVRGARPLAESGPHSRPRSIYVLI